MQQATNAEDHTSALKISDCQVYGLKQKGWMVDTGATSHITMDMHKVKKFATLELEKHFLELADRTRTSSVALRKGYEKVCLKDSENNDEGTVHTVICTG